MATPSMTRSQRLVLILAAIAICIAFIYAPFHYRNVSYGYAWIFSPPFEGARLTVDLLIAEWLGILLVAALVYLAAGSQRKEDKRTAPEELLAHRSALPSTIVTRIADIRFGRTLRFLFRATFSLLFFLVGAVIFGVISELTRGSWFYVVATVLVVVLIFPVMVWAWQMSGRFIRSKPIRRSVGESSVAANRDP